MQKIEEVSEQIRKDAKLLLPNKPFVSIVSLQKKGNDWDAIIEVLERKAVPDSQDLLGWYEIKLSGGKEVESYKQIGLRHRNDTKAPAQA